MTRDKEISQRYRTKRALTDGVDDLDESGFKDGYHQKKYVEISVKVK